jgi:hypothetical protein
MDLALSDDAGIIAIVRAQYGHLAPSLAGLLSEQVLCKIWNGLTKEDKKVILSPDSW